MRKFEQRRRQLRSSSLRFIIVAVALIVVIIVVVITVFITDCIGFIVMLMMVRCKVFLLVNRRSTEVYRRLVAIAIA